VFIHPTSAYRRRTSGLNFTQGLIMVRRPDDISAFEFAVLSSLRAVQLHRGCTPRVEQSPKVAVTAQQEVAERKVLPLRQSVDAVLPAIE